MKKLSLLLLLSALAVACNNIQTPAPNQPPVVDSSNGQNEMVNWKAYVNSRAGYQIEYPQSTVINEEVKYGDKNPVTNLVNNLDLISFVSGNQVYSIYTGFNFHLLNIETYIQDPASDIESHDLNQYNKIIVGGKTAYTSKSSLTTYFMSGGNVYWISARDKQENLSVNFNDAIYTRLLASFMFTK